MAQWVIYYADGSSFSSEDGPPEAAPRRYVQVILQENKRTGERDLLHGSGNDFEFFCWHGDQWVPHNRTGLDQYLDLPGAEKIRLCGFWSSEEVFWDCYNRACDTWKHLTLRVVP